MKKSLRELVTPESWWLNIGQNALKLKRVLASMEVEVTPAIQYLIDKYTYPFRIIYSFRTKEEQQKYYEKGTGIAPFYSYHNIGMAIDIIPRSGYDGFTFKGELYCQGSNRLSWERLGFYQQFEKKGLKWGGRWSKPFDPAHLQHPTILSRPKMFKASYYAHDYHVAMDWRRTWEKEKLITLDMEASARRASEQAKSKVKDFLSSFAKTPAGEALAELVLLFKKIFYGLLILFVVYLILLFRPLIVNNLK